MTWLLGPAASLVGGLFGANSADKAAEAQKKAAKKQLAFTKDIYGKETAEATAQLPNQQAALQTGVTNEVNALRSGQTGALNALAADTRAQEGIYDPYRDAGVAGLDANAGFYGTDPAQSDEMYNAFLNSPYYKAKVAPAIAATERATNRQFAGSGQVGAFQKALQDRLAEVGGRGFMDYVGFGERAANRGLDASNAFSGAMGRNAALGAGAYLDTAGRTGSAYGTAARGTSSNIGDYLTRRANLASGLTTGVNNSLGARGEASAAGALGTGNAMGSAFGSIANQIGNYFAPSYTQSGSTPVSYAVNANPFTYGGPR